jgi:hypothetical protein
LEIRELDPPLMNRHFRTRPGSVHTQKHFAAVDFEPQLPTLSFRTEMRGGSRGAGPKEGSHGMRKLGEQGQTLGASRSRRDVHAVDDDVEDAR